MKKNIMKTGWMMGLALLASATLASCGDDDKGAPSDANQISGTYSGSANINVSGIDCGEMTFDVKIDSESEADHTATVTLPECSFIPPIENPREFTIPSISVTGVNVTENNNAYKISIQEYKATIDDVTFSVDIDGTIIGKDADIRYVITPGRMPMPINFTFTGVRK